MSAGDQWAAEPAGGGYGVRPRSGLVTAMAVINFVFGGLGILCGILGFLGGAFLASAGSAGSDFERELERQMRQKGVQVPGGQVTSKTVQTVGTIVMITSLVSLLWGAGAITGGIGLIGRKNWGRILTLVLAGVSGLLAILSLIQIGSTGAMGLLNVLIYGFYTVFAFVVLLNPNRAREFA